MRLTCRWRGGRVFTLEVQTYILQEQSGAAVYGLSRDDGICPTYHCSRAGLEGYSQPPHPPAQSWRGQSLRATCQPSSRGLPAANTAVLQQARIRSPEFWMMEKHWGGGSAELAAEHARPEQWGLLGHKNQHVEISEQTGG